MTEKFTIKRQPRRKVPFVTRADTASDELKVRTLEAMALREQENKSKIKGIRNIPKMALVAAIVLLTLLVATGAAFALRSLWDDLFEVNQRQTVDGHSVEIRRVRLENNCITLRTANEPGLYLHFEGFICDDKGNKAEVFSGYSPSDCTLLVPDMKKVVNSKSKKYRCELTAYGYSEEKLDKTAFCPVEDDVYYSELFPDVTFRFSFDISNEYIVSVLESEDYEIDYSTKAENITLDFKKLMVSDAETSMLLELKCDDRTAIDWDYMMRQSYYDTPDVRVAVRRSDGTYFPGFFHVDGPVIACGQKHYLLLKYFATRRSDQHFIYEPSLTFEVERIKLPYFTNHTTPTKCSVFHCPIEDISLPVQYDQSGLINADYNVSCELGNITYQFKSIKEWIPEPVDDDNNETLPQHELEIIADITLKDIAPYADGSNNEWRFEPPMNYFDEELSDSMEFAAFRGSSEIMRFYMPLSSTWWTEDGDTIPKYTEWGSSWSMTSPEYTPLHGSISSYFTEEEAESELSMCDLFRRLKIDSLKLISIGAYETNYESSQTNVRNRQILIFNGVNTDYYDVNTPKEVRYFTDRNYQYYENGNPDYQKNIDDFIFDNGWTAEEYTFEIK